MNGANESEPMIAAGIRPAASRALILCLMVLVGFFLAVCYFYLEGVYLNLPYPRNTFLFLPSARFGDYFQVVQEGASLKPYLKFESAQYPFLVIVAFLFSRLHGAYSYWIYVAIWSSAFVMLALALLPAGQWYERAIITFTLIFLSYPFLFTLDRGNFEGLVFVLVLAFGHFFSKGRYLGAAALLAMAAAMKLVPLFLIVLFLREKKYRALTLSVALTAVLMLASLKAFHGGVLVNLDYVLHGSNLLANSTFGSFTSLQSNLVQRGVSFLTLLKIAHLESGWFSWTTSSHFTTVYLIVVAIIGVLVCIYAVLIEKVLWRRVAVLIFAMLLLPTVSADYKLLYVFLPALLFIASPEERSRLDGVYLVLFGLLLIPKSYYYFQNLVSDAYGAHDISISVVINILDMAIFSLILMAAGTRAWLLDRNARAQLEVAPGKRAMATVEQEPPL